MIELLLQAEGALSLGLLDRAETLYTQVAAADPRNAIAVVGLARVGLERGNERGALDLARRALTIDPENSAAQRMTQRLEEVLRFRGAALPAATIEREPSSTQPRAVEPGPRPEPAKRSQPAPAPAAPAGRRSIVDRLLRRRR